MKKIIKYISTACIVLPILIQATLLFAAEQPGPPGDPRPTSGGLLKIGAISAENPTVSSLLLQIPALRDNCWDIINDEQNKDKNYAGIQIGTDIYYNPATRELLWTDTTSNTAPVAVMPETAFEFPPAVDGEKITHDFIIQNRGNEDLAVLEVKTTWGCTAASVPRPIPPGGEGIITISVATRNRGGQTLKKTVRVITNDPKNREIPLNLKAQVDKIYTISPNSVALKGFEGETIKQTVTLVPSKAFPFTLKEIKAKRGQYIKYQFEEIKIGKDVRYKVTVENTRKDAGVYFDTLYLKTDSEKKPEIQITIFGNIGKASDRPA